MVLSETRSLQLSWVMRGCIGLQWRLGAEAQNRLTSEQILSPDPSVSRRTRLATAKDVPQGDGTDSWFEMLKLLVVSFVQRRNALLSSIGLE